jgi:hypothetical protein
MELAYGSTPAGMEADESEFVPLEPEEIIKAAKKEKAGNAS